MNFPGMCFMNGYNNCPKNHYHKKQLTVDEVAQNLVKLLTPLSSQSTTTQDQENEALIGKRIRHRGKDSDGSEEWYYGRILSLVPGTDNCYL